MNSDKERSKDYQLRVLWDKQRQDPALKLGKFHGAEGSVDSHVAYVTMWPDEALALHRTRGDIKRVFRSMAVHSGLPSARGDGYFTSVCKSKIAQGWNWPEINRSQGYLRKELDIVNPRMVIVLGQRACQTLLNVHLNTGHGQTIAQKHRGGYIPYIASHYPSIAAQQQGMEWLVKVFERAGELLAREGVRY